MFRTAAKALPTRSFHQSSRRLINQLASKDDFKSAVGSGVSFVDFFATWCGPCRMVAPLLEKLEPEYPGIKFHKVDIEEVPELATEFEVSAVPTFILFKDGEPAKVLKGAVPAYIKHTLEQYK